MTRDELIETMAKGIHQSMCHNPNLNMVPTLESLRIYIVPPALAAIEAAGLAIVPVEATEALKRIDEYEIDASSSMVNNVFRLKNIARDARAAMIAASPLAKEAKP